MSLLIHVNLYLQVRRSGAYESVSREQLTAQLPLAELHIYLYIYPLGLTNVAPQVLLPWLERNVWAS